MYSRDNCLIQPNTTIGSDGYAFERADDFRTRKISSLWQSSDRNDVEIFANCSSTRIT
ncbi:MAG: hypothetical protein P0116_06595 [Candidatus Nitrosocosmicus sp.]|nr:hypothetical protein [Candidatus Nitrosocosmicus sp.]